MTQRLSLIADQKGMTLVEVLASMVISIICVTAFLQLSLSGRTHKIDTDRSIALKEILTNNTIELKSRPMEELPEAPSCLLRFYDLRGNFLEEKIVKTAGDFCKIEPPSQDKIQVIWQTQNSNSIKASFSSDSMKIPQLTSNLRKATLYVRGFTHAGSSSLLTNQVTIFKR